MDYDPSKSFLKKALKRNVKDPREEGAEQFREEIISFPNVTTPIAIINIFQNMTARLLLQEKP